MTTDSESRKEQETSGGAEDRASVPKTSDWILHSLNRIHEDVRETRKEISDVSKKVERIDERTGKIGDIESKLGSLQRSFWIATGVVAAIVTIPTVVWVAIKLSAYLKFISPAVGG